MGRGGPHCRTSLFCHVVKAPTSPILEHRIGLFVLVMAVQVDVFADMRISSKEIFVAIIIKVIGSNSPSTHCVRSEANPDLIGGVSEEPFAIVQKQREGLTSQCGHA